MANHVWDKEELQESISRLHAAIEGQQKLAEQELQQTLQKAATNQAELQRIKAMHAHVLAMQEALEEQGPRNNPEFLLEMVKQLAEHVHTQQDNSQKQVTQALQLAVSALTESQTALTENRSLAQMAQMVKECEAMLQHKNNAQSNLQ